MENDSRKITTLRDVAREANLSVTAVSRVLNGKDGVSQETAERVRQIAQRMNYSPNVIAKSLRLNVTKTIGVITSDSSNGFFARVIKGVDDAMVHKGYNIILCNSNSEKEKERRAIEVLLSKRVDGLIIVAPLLTSEEDVSFLHSLGIPVVLISRKADGHVSYVISDNVSGAYQLVCYMVQKGYQKIHFLNIPEDISSGKERLDGYKKALAENGIPFRESLVRYAKPTVESGYNVMTELLGRGEKVEALFCGCDVLAIGAMQAIYGHGLKIPRDIVLAGYDDIELAAYLRVPLTTVAQPGYEMGYKGAEMILKKIAGNKKDYHLVLKAELVVRESV